MKEVVQRLIAKGLVGFRPPTTMPIAGAVAVQAASEAQKRGLTKEQAERAYHAERKRRQLGYQPWKPRGPGRPPKDAKFCRWCGRLGWHVKGCKKRQLV